MRQDISKIVDFVKQLAAGTTSPLIRWLSFAGCIVLSIVAAKIVEFIFRHVIKVWTRKTRTNLDDQIVHALHKPLVFSLSVSGIYGSCYFLHLGGFIDFLLHKIYLALMIVTALKLMLHIARIFCRKIAQQADSKGNSYNVLLSELLLPAAQTVLWSTAILLLMQNVFDINIGALLAGAGIAVMAIAFAAQNTIANIFGAISLIIDRPFRLGERIQVGDKDGMVEAIGLRSTRLRALDGTVWNIPNRTMTDTPIHNYSARPFFKETFTITLTYNTTAADLMRGKKILHAILDNYPLFDMETQPPVVIFGEMANYSLNLQATCWFQTTNFGEFRQAKEEINFRILEEFNKEHLEIAFPTQTICLENSGK